MDRALHRNPLLEAPLTDAMEVVMLDTLHTIYLGVILRYVSEVFWRTIEGRVWGGADTSLDMCVRNLKVDLIGFYDEANVPQDSRIGDLTVGMMGKREASTIKTKAGETACLLPFAIELCRRHRDRLRASEALLAAGEALAEHLRLLRESPARLTLGTAQTLLDLCVRHLRLIL
eukprot:15393630-Alexandrium_andersonii.AAC.1